MRVRVLPSGRLLVGILLLAWLIAPTPASALPADSTAAGAPDPPAWPVPELVEDIRDLLVQYYDQEVSSGTPHYYRAPEREADKPLSSKDPDTLFEYSGGPGTACHAAASSDDFVTCTGHRLAATFGTRYSAGSSLFDPAGDFLTNEGYAQLAGYYALYHAFVRDFDAPLAGQYVTGEARNAKQYHEAMIRAYELHMRDIIVKMFAERQGDPRFQLDMTRSIGLLEANYVRVVEALEEFAAWESSQQRRNALAVVNGLNQRLWWEWVWTQSSGPRTAGFVDLGSEAVYEAAAAADPSWAGTNVFVHDGRTIRSLRQASVDTGTWSGLWFDADYAVPGEWWCYGQFAAGTSSLTKCLAQAARAGRDGTKSPFGQYYGVPDADPPCSTRAGSVTTETCEFTNLGSIAEEWTAAFLGARLGTFLMKELAATSDPDLPAGALGANVYEVVSARLGYGIAGWHGGEGRADDLEWQFGGGRTVAIRTLSAARHDFEMQSGRYSLGETDVSAVSGGGRNGDTWFEDRQEYPGGAENYMPGPNPAYGSYLFWLVLADATSDGPSRSLYDEWHRNEVDEFNSWIWLMQSIFYRCLSADEPADGRCFAYSPSDWPNPDSILRQRIYTRPEDSSINMRYRYLWRDPLGALDEAVIAGRDTSCRGTPGLPMGSVHNWATGGDAGYLTDESGTGAYSAAIGTMGGLMRLIAARFPLEPVNPALADAYEEQRTDVLVPWYRDAYNQLKGILALYAEPYPIGYGYVPAIENSVCSGFDPAAPGDSGNVMMLSWQMGTGDSVTASAVRRAMGYSLAAQWYWWYDSGWLDIDAAEW